MKPELVDNEGKVLEGATDGNLCITDSWPGQARSVYGDHERFVQTYFSTYKGKYFTGTAAVAMRMATTGSRVASMTFSTFRGIVSGQPKSNRRWYPTTWCRKAAVVGYPHSIKGQGIYCYVTVMSGHEGNEALRADLVKHVRSEIGPIASPDKIQFAPGLPKTRSGKIMRRILRKIAEDDFGALGDTSTLADPVSSRPDREPAEPGQLKLHHSLALPPLEFLAKLQNEKPKAGPSGFSFVFMVVLGIVQRYPALLGGIGRFGIE